MLEEGTVGPGRSVSKCCLAVPVIQQMETHREVCILPIIIPKRSKTSARSPKLRVLFKKLKKKKKVIETED